MEEERASLMRIVALILALADLAELACSRSPAVCGLICWILRPAESVLSAYVGDLPDTDAPSTPISQLGNVQAEARRLALRFLVLAHALAQEPEFSFLDEPSSRAEPFSHGPVARTDAIEAPGSPQDRTSARHPGAAKRNPGPRAPPVVEELQQFPNCLRRKSIQTVLPPIRSGFRVPLRGPGMTEGQRERSMPFAIGMNLHAIADFG
jgi:hypothetical protein